MTPEGIQGGPVHELAAVIRSALGTPSSGNLSDDLFEKFRIWYSQHQDLPLDEAQLIFERTLRKDLESVVNAYRQYPR